MPSICIKAWLADGWGYTTTQGSGGDSDGNERDFLENTCDSCSYYHGTMDGDCDDMTDNDGNPIESCRVNSQCPCYEDGVSYVDFPCLAGHDGPSESDGDDETFKLPAMVFSIHLDRSNLQVTRYSPINIEIQVARACDYAVSETFRAGNVYDDTTVCWGNDNTIPRSLPEAVEAYADAPGNDDLLSAKEFKYNASRSRNADLDEAIDDACIIEPGYDAVLIASATVNPSAFLLLAGSGAVHSNGLLMLGVRRYQHINDDGNTLDGSVIDGYITDPINGRAWLVIDHPDAIEEDGSDYDGKALLLGQIQSTTTLADPCSSTAPSSLEPAALAAG